MQTFTIGIDELGIPPPFSDAYNFYPPPNSARFSACAYYTPKYLWPFYCAMLCISAVFAVGRCPSVSPSDTFVYCIQMAEDSVKLLSRPVSPIILFLTPCAGTPFQGERLHWGRQKYTRGKICNFRLKSRFISETARDRPIVATER